MAEKREEVKLLFRSYVRKLEGLRERSRSYRFIDSNHEIWKDIAVTLALLREFHFEEDYGELLSKVLRYLRVKKVRHSALFARDKSLISLALYTGSDSVMSQMLFQRMHLGSVHLSSNPVIVNQYDYDDSSD